MLVQVALDLVGSPLANALALAVALLPAVFAVVGNEIGGDCLERLGSARLFGGLGRGRIVPLPDFLEIPHCGLAGGADANLADRANGDAPMLFAQFVLSDQGSGAALPNAK